VHLDDTGVAQAAKAAARLDGLRLAGIVSSPLERCRETARALIGSQDAGLRVGTNRGLTECDYGDWQGRALKDLGKEKLWRTVQTQPSAAAFPGGESLAEMAARAVAALRRHDAAVESQHGSGAVWAAVSHGDVIKAVLADALGMHLDLFQRLHVDPASISIVRYADSHPFVLAVNTHEGGLGWLAAPRRRRRRDAAVGGGAGPGTV
jgi:probable phosphomutase (TIGR03848 family)